LGQFLFAALGSLCREAELAPALVGTPNDIRDLIAYDTSNSKSARQPPRLARGWRAEFVGRLFDDLLAGKVSVSVQDATSEAPLRFERGG
jgi:ribonuclease D